MVMTPGSKEHYLGERCGIWKPMLRHLKQIWIAYHGSGMTAMLQLCYHKSASNVRLKIYELSIPKDYQQEKG